MIGYARITRHQFYAKGAFSNSRLVRKQAGSSWSYWERIYD